MLKDKPQIRSHGMDIIRFYVTSHLLNILSEVHVMLIGHMLTFLRIKIKSWITVSTRLSTMNTEGIKRYTSYIIVTNGSKLANDLV